MFSGFEHKIVNISIKNMIHKENSSDLSSGRRPIVKSDEFSLWIILVIQIGGLAFDVSPPNATLLAQG
jgi:hypothetical protein